MGPPNVGDCDANNEILVANTVLVVVAQHTPHNRQSRVSPGIDTAALLYVPHTALQRERRFPLSWWLIP
jgi:hypothetical protein